MFHLRIFKQGNESVFLTGDALHGFVDLSHVKVTVNYRIQMRANCTAGVLFLSVARLYYPLYVSIS